MADVTIGARLQLDANDGIKSLKQLKDSIREAKGDLIGMTKEFGATSEQARTAAKRVAELEDNISDAKQLVDAFNPDQKFKALGQALNGALGGFTALTGAMGLLGVESEEVQKQLLKVQSALALSQGLNQLGDSINSFKNLGKTIVQTLGKNGLIGVAIAGVAALGAALAGVFDGKTRAQKELENSLKELGKASADATKEVYELNNAFKLAKAGVISKEAALKQYNDGMGKTVGFAKDLNEAEKLTADNAKAYIEVQGLKAQANYILAKSAEFAAKALIMEAEPVDETSGGMIMSAVPGLRKKAIAGLKEDSDKYLKLVDEINLKIQQKSAGFTGSTTKSTGKATTIAGREKEKEVEEVSAFQKLLNEIAAEQADKEAQLHAVKIQRNTELTASNNAATLAYLDNKTKENEAAAQQLVYEQFIADSRQKLAGSVMQALGALSDLVGKQTAAGKVLAIAEATINTYLAASSILKNTARNPLTGAIPGYAIAQMVATIAAGLVTVRNIVKTPVPGTGSGGSVPNANIQNAPLQPQTPLSQRTRLDDEQLNQIGNATVRAFVVESDVTNNQERIRRLNRAARIA